VIKSFIDPSVYPFVTPYPGFTAEISRPPKPAQHLPAPRVPEWRLVSVKLPASYPTLDLCKMLRLSCVSIVELNTPSDPSMYPWNLESIYPPMTVEDYLGVSVRLPSRYPWIDICMYNQATHRTFSDVVWTDPALYPFVQPYPSMSGISDHRTDPPGSLDPEEHGHARGFLTLSKVGILPRPKSRI
jgi:hypothetical protein